MRIERRGKIQACANEHIVQAGRKEVAQYDQAKAMQCQKACVPIIYTYSM